MTQEHLFHAVAASNLAHMIQEDGIHFYGRSEPDVELEDEALEWVRDGGWLYTVANTDLDLCESEFVQDGLILELAPRVDHPEIVLQGRNGREKVVRVEEWEVVGAMRPLVDEDGEVIEQQEFSLLQVLKKEC